MTDQQNQLLENWEKDFRADLKTMFRNKEKPHDIENAIVYVMQGLIRLQDSKTRQECAEIVEGIVSQKIEKLDLRVPGILDLIEGFGETKQKILNKN